MSCFSPKASMSPRSENPATSFDRMSFWAACVSAVVLYVFSWGMLIQTSCAHVSAVAQACKPQPADVDTALTDLQSDGWQAALESLVVAKGICVARAAVQQVIDALSGAQALETTGTPSSAEIVSRGKAFLTANPQ